jgi:hypothetical protein
MYYAQYEPGERVAFEYTIKANYWETDGSGYMLVPSYREVKGTAMGWKRRKVKVWLDEPVDLKVYGVEKRVREIVCVYPKNHKGYQSIAKLDEEKVPICIRCGKPKGKVNAKGKGEMCFVKVGDCVYSEKTEGRNEEGKSIGGNT